MPRTRVGRLYFRSEPCPPGLYAASGYENDSAGAGDTGERAKVFLTTCNPTTVQDDVVWLVERGAQACAWRDMSDADWQQSWGKAIAWGPTHLCEMGADITTLLHQRGNLATSSPVWKQPAPASAAWAIFVPATLSLTGTISRLRDCITAIWWVSRPGTPSSRRLT